MGVNRGLSGIQTIGLVKQYDPVLYIDSMSN